MYGLPGPKAIVSSPPQQPWIKFNDSPTPSSISPQQQQQQSSSSPSAPTSLVETFSPPENNLNSVTNGMQPANFDFNAASIEKDPKILHPVALRVSPDGPIMSYETNNGSSLFLKSLPTPSSHSAQESSSSSSVQLTSQSFQNVGISVKKDLPLVPPPPPRPHRRPGHARSSSLDLTCLEKNLPSASANHGRSKIITNCSNISSNNALGLTSLPPGVDRRGAFTVYRKIDQHHHSVKETAQESNRWFEILKAKYHPPKPVQMPRSIYESFHNKDLVEYIQDLQERCYRLETINNELIHELANVMEEKSFYGDHDKSSK